MTIRKTIFNIITAAIMIVGFSTTPTLSDEGHIHLLKGSNININASLCVNKDDAINVLNIKAEYGFEKSIEVYLNLKSSGVCIDVYQGLNVHLNELVYSTDGSLVVAVTDPNSTNGQVFFMLVKDGVWFETEEEENNHQGVRANL